MPIYKYVCPDCSLNFEEIVSFEESTEVKCPECSTTSERQFPDSVSVKTTLDPKKDTIATPKEIDKVVGEDADKKREIIENRQKNKTAPNFGFAKEVAGVNYHDIHKARQDKRRKGLEPKEIEIPQDEDGKYYPEPFS